MINLDMQLENLNSNNATKRIDALKNIIKIEKRNKMQSSSNKNTVPLHFTSTAYFSKYSPTTCAYVAYRSGCYGVGINDYATVSYFKELIKASKLLNLKYSIGYHIECSPLFGEDRGVVYGYGISKEKVKKISKKLKVFSDVKMQEVLDYLKVLNKEITSLGVEIKVATLLKDAKERMGIITEKHLANELAKLLLKKYDKGKQILDILRINFNIESEKATLFLSQEENAYYVEDLSKLLYEQYILKNVKKTVCDVSQIEKLNSEYGVITSYLLPFNKYDEEQLVSAIEKLKKLNIFAITLKATKFSQEDYQKTFDLLTKNGILPIPLNRLGLPRQIIPTNEKIEKNFDVALSIIGNAVSASCDVDDFFFGKRTCEKFPDILKRIELFSNIGKRGK